MSRRSGRCLCGAVRFEIDAHDLRARACHCDDCRRWTGSAVYVIGPFADIAVNADAPVVWHDASAWAERGFCGRCGSSLFWRAKTGGGATSALLGALDDQTGVELIVEIFCDRRLPVLSANPSAEQKSRAAVIDRYTADYDGDWRSLSDH